jgi:hypothetical protein
MLASRVIECHYTFGVTESLLLCRKNCHLFIPPQNVAIGSGSVVSSAITAHGVGNPQLRDGTSCGSPVYCILCASRFMASRIHGFARKDTRVDQSLFSPRPGPMHGRMVHRPEVRAATATWPCTLRSVVGYYLSYTSVLDFRIIIEFRGCVLLRCNLPVVGPSLLYAWAVAPQPLVNRVCTCHVLTLSGSKRRSWKLTARPAYHRRRDTFSAH